MKKPSKVAELIESLKSVEDASERADLLNRIVANCDFGDMKRLINLSLNNNASFTFEELEKAIFARKINISYVILLIECLCKKADIERIKGCIVETLLKSSFLFQVLVDEILEYFTENNNLYTNEMLKIMLEQAFEFGNESSLKYIREKCEELGIDFKKLLEKLLFCKLMLALEAKDNELLKKIKYLCEKFGIEFELLQRKFERLEVKEISPSKPRNEDEKVLKNTDPSDGHILQ